MPQLLNIIDENDNIIGEGTREEIHKNGLLHREVHVWIFNDKEEILFQRRAAGADNFPNLLDASVGGHVEIGDSYEKTALKELREETGIKANEEDLIFLVKMHRSVFDEVTGATNNAMRSVYAYRYNGGIEDLKPERGVGFEFWPIKKVLNLEESEKKRFIPGVLSKEFVEIFEAIDLLA
jgi:isopentenyldiphosphate isomerase